MEDKRVTKTKSLLKKTLIELLEERPFEQITVKELCQRAYVSRITFYTHYGDKYALVDEIFQDMLALGMENYRQLQAENNPEADPIHSYLNMADAILTLYFDQYPFFCHASPEQNPYLASAFYNEVFKAVELRTRHTARSLRVKYSAEKVTALLCWGMLGFVGAARQEKDPPETIRRETREVLSGILASGVLLERSGA